MPYYSSSISILLVLYLFFYLCYDTPMKKFVYSYLLLLPIMFGVLYWNLSPLAEFVNHYQTKMLLFFLDMGLKDGQLQGIDIMISPRYKVIITKACNGMIPYLLLLSSMLAYPASWSHKFLWAIIGYMVLVIVNIIRLFIVVYCVTKTPSNFELSHDIFGNLLFMSFGLLLFYIFIKGAIKSLE